MEERRRVGAELHQRKTKHFPATQMILRGDSRRPSDHLGEIRSAERYLFEETNYEQGQNGPEECRASRPTRDQQRPPVNRRMPERYCDQAVEED